MLPKRRKGMSPTVMVSLVVGLFVTLTSIGIGTNMLLNTGDTASQQSSIEKLADIKEKSENMCGASSAGPVATSTDFSKTFTEAESVRFLNGDTLEASFPDGTSDSVTLEGDCDYSFSVEEPSDLSTIQTSESETWQFSISAPAEGVVDITARTE